VRGRGCRLEDSPVVDDIPAQKVTVRSLAHSSSSLARRLVSSRSSPTPNIYKHRATGQTSAAGIVSERERWSGTAARNGLLGRGIEVILAMLVRMNKQKISIGAPPKDALP
jgi:hypothetical protein